MEFSSFVTMKKSFKLYLKILNNSDFEINGDDKDMLISPYLWNLFQKVIKGHHD